MSKYETKVKLHLHVKRFNSETASAILLKNLHNIFKPSVKLRVSMKFVTWHVSEKKTIKVWARSVFHWSRCYMARKKQFLFHTSCLKSMRYKDITWLENPHMTVRFVLYQSKKLVFLYSHKHKHSKQHKKKCVWLVTDK